MGIVHIQDFLHLRTCINSKEAILYKTMLDVVGQIRLCFPWSQTPNFQFRCGLITGKQIFSYVKIPSGLGTYDMHHHQTDCLLMTSHRPHRKG